ncbi:putative quinol monooxygenase [Photobacterium damselae]|uniref:putative quinol monooxygenase n=1 Tax=Photobacterium damselae TaxID=38293 RepID=UPI0012AD29AF|nr:putative quinol monooxygenase [Photobacterium damselae]EHA1081719.1 antibiotic biosynthesis monooxygenase [Photobacterium damselae]MCG3826542.1 antibiotic biosynthesis monooxygenase [Photobacterium damselae]MCG9707095.1 antibiotic biosynthesis monooxygenase [Photobacterium damselae]NVH47336.1 antibiotic biosynthesis monooxygenase [Photobacterium damselae subsp. damselae]
MSKLTVVANIVAKEGQIDLVKSELLKLIDVTRAEDGCISYDLHQDNENPAHFVFFENWSSEDKLQAHLNNTPIAEYVKATEGAIELFTINKMTHIG